MTDVLHYKGYSTRAAVEFDDGAIFGRILGIDDNVAFHAYSPPEFERVFRAAVDDYLQTCREIGKRPDKAYSGKVMFRVAPEVHRAASIAAEARGLSLNEFGEAALSQAAGLPS